MLLHLLKSFFFISARNIFVVYDFGADLNFCRSSHENLSFGNFLTAFTSSWPNRVGYQIGLGYRIGLVTGTVTVLTLKKHCFSYTGYEMTSALLCNR